MPTLLLHSVFSKVSSHSKHYSEWMFVFCFLFFFLSLSNHVLFLQAKHWLKWLQTSISLAGSSCHSLFCYIWGPVTCSRSWKERVTYELCMILKIRSFPDQSFTLNDHFILDTSNVMSNITISGDGHSFHNHKSLFC